MILHPWDISGPHRPKGLVGPALSVEDQIPNEQHVLVTILGLGDFALIQFWMMYSSCLYRGSACSVELRGVEASNAMHNRVGRAMRYDADK